MTVKPYRFPKGRKKVPHPPATRLRTNDGIEAEHFAGEIRGLRASKAEERCARALDKKKIQYEFRYGTEGGRNRPGWKEIDFLINKNGVHYPVDLLETSFVHKGTRPQDELDRAKIMQYLNQAGYSPQPFEWWNNDHFATQKDADNFIWFKFG